MTPRREEIRTAFYEIMDACRTAIKHLPRDVISVTDADYANFRAPMMSMEIIAAKLPSDDSGCALLQARIAHMQQGIHPEVDPDFIRVWDASQTERWGKLLSDLHESVEETAKPYQCKKGMAKLRGSY